MKGEGGCAGGEAHLTADTYLANVPAHLHHEGL